MATDIHHAQRPEVIAPGAGHHFHFLGHLATVKVSSGGSGAMSVVEFTGPRGFGPPLHRHQDEDELFVVLEGELAFHRGDERLVAGRGTVAFLPHGVAHTFQVLSPTARFTCVTASLQQPPRFDRMVAALGDAVDVPTLPEPGYIDPSRVADVCQEHGIDIVGPPPPPLG